MSDYLEISIACRLPEQMDVLVAELNGIGFDGFEEAENVLKAYILEAKFNGPVFESVIGPHELPYSVSLVKDQNWNQLWESDFEPVVVDDFCTIRANFHSALPGVRHDIIITPKMSFGTGHHATTRMMVAAMRRTNLQGKSVIDFGTGTGVLAILAEKCGASCVTAIDNDDWSIANARENLEVNHCRKVSLVQADSFPPGQRFDVILANINKNTILAHLPLIAASLSYDGLFLVSGLLLDDVNVMVSATGALGLEQAGLQEQGNWVCMQFRRVQIC